MGHDIVFFFFFFFFFYLSLVIPRVPGFFQEAVIFMCPAPDQTIIIFLT